MCVTRTILLIPNMVIESSKGLDDTSVIFREFYVFARRRNVGCFSRGQADDADFLAANFDYGVWLEFAVNRFGGGGVDIRGNHREIQRFDEFAKHFLAVVEFVIAKGHRLIAKQVHDLRAVLAHILLVIQRPREAISAIQQQRVFRFGADLLDDGCQTRCAAISVYLNFVMRMFVVGMNNRKVKSLCILRISSGTAMKMTAIKHINTVIFRNIRISSWHKRTNRHYS